MTIAEEKQRLRKEMMAHRRDLAPLDVEMWSRQICERLLQWGIWEEMGCVGGYWPMRKEVDLRGALDALLLQGVEVGLPIVKGRGQALGFRRWQKGESLERRPLGVMEPTEQAPWCFPRALWVPLLAFDRRGHRLGYGAGFYDRTIELLRSQGPLLTVGIAFEMQMREEVPVDGGDQPLDWVLTEQGLLRMSEA
ncbi:MAG: 5-formyltetrahydrofolate cyclo-ligase [Myxococcales bacterium]|nr:5-formyltetrahydrofolate cyclo-ligase [Myxococcales bacterium]